MGMGIGMGMGAVVELLQGGHRPGRPDSGWRKVIPVQPCAASPPTA